MTSQRLPVPGSDDGSWGTILNDYLGVAHNSDGTLQANAVTAAGAITSVNGKTAINGSVSLAASDVNAVATVNGKSPVSGAVTLAASDVGALTQSSADARYLAGVKQTSAPNSPATNDLWYDSANDLWKRWSGSAWVAAGSTSYDAYGAAAAAVAGASVAGPAGPAGLSWRGAYSNATTYAINDAVSYNGNSFIATAGVTGTAPGSPNAPIAPWNTLAQAGTSGGTIVPASRLWVSGTLTPSASANTNGSSLTATPGSGFSGFGLITIIQAIFAGTFNAETATVSVTVTYSDGTNSTVSPGPQTLTATSASTQVAASTTFVNLHKDGVYITSVVVALKSSIASSQVSATVKMVALQA